MAGVSSNLYPPILPTYQSAFIYSDNCTVYFSLSKYNSNDDIKAVHAIIKHQDNNASALLSSKYPCEIKVCSLQRDESRDDDYQYYITLEPGEIENSFTVGEYYKIQLRFSSIISNSTPDNTWFIENEDNFSEWSTVCLIKAIDTPTITLTNFEDNQDVQLLTATSLDLSGTVSFGNDESEIVDHYQITLYDDEDNVLTDSSTLYCSNYYNINEIHYTLPYELVNGNTYKIIVSIVSNNLYELSKTYNFQILSPEIYNPLNVRIDLTGQSEIGAIAVTVVDLDLIKRNCYLVMRRTSNKSNFLIWEDVQKFTISNSAINLTWLDLSIESGTYYKYSIQKVDTQNNRFTATESAATMVLFDDMFLTAEETQLRIKYDPSISSFKRNVLDSKVETLGGTYPFIKRNGNVNYYSFTISGLITFWNEYTENIDITRDSIRGSSSSSEWEKYLEKTFCTREELYGSYLDIYDTYNSTNDITKFNDYLYEADYRKKVIDFLYKDNIKLFRSLTEGSFLVRLTDISLTPKNELGRYVYTFSATATEIDECSITNLDKYDIINLGSFSDFIPYDYTIEGQVADTFDSYTDILENYIKPKYTENVDSNITITVKALNNIKIEMNEDPYAIAEDSNGFLTKATDTTAASNIITYGYLAIINGNLMIIGKDGIFESGSNVNISSLSFPVETNCLINYQAGLFEQVKIEQSYKNYSYKYKLGQLWDIFNYNESIYDQIYLKYYYLNGAKFSYIISLYGLWITAEPGTIFYIKETKDSVAQKFIISENEHLNFYDEDRDYSIAAFSCQGMKLSKTIILNEIDDIIDIINPIENIIYQLNTNEKWAYHSGQWYAVDENNEIQCPVEAVIDYYCEVMEGEYAT